MARESLRKLHCCLQLTDGRDGSAQRWILKGSVETRRRVDGSGKTLLTPSILMERRGPMQMVNASRLARAFMAKRNEANTSRKDTGSTQTHPRLDMQSPHDNPGPVQISNHHFFQCSPSLVPVRSEDQVSYFCLSVTPPNASQTWSQTHKPFDNHNSSLSTLRSTR
ncbi:hypothetical protein BCR39DRAFT_254584 [Naematelia encephala]|uniref:Uncharacterized protein n=1 Tax=Naematelia encephala TaxID=71784 RepID=A0A1Y2AVM0_9TREE|nr:hypothetical protein BCR39DRAFT_254584 [Naematelia encephala]